MKRPCEDSSSAEEDVDAGRESVYPGHVKASYLGSGSPTSQMMERKRRRGVIEKRRRDRINSSLSELRRLVPTAVEKQGSAKLEKAEILQMTVDHLKGLQAGCLDVHTLALDFLSLGFRECLTEVSRYLSAVEGLEACDPLQARLLSHLTSVALAMTSQRPPLHPHPPHLHPQHWAAVVRPPYGLNALSPPPDVSGASQRPVEVLQRSSALASTSSSSSSSSSSSRPYRPWGTEVGAF